jgi:hypothetical protein
MGHAIQAILLPGACRADAPQRWDVVPVNLAHGWSMVPITHYFSAYWQAKIGAGAALAVPTEFCSIFPSEGVVGQIAADLAGRHTPFAVIMTDYFGGVGEQWACAFPAATATVPSTNGAINQVLQALGVVADPGKDEFDTLGLAAHRHPPEYLHKYEDLCDEIGV